MNDETIRLREETSEQIKGLITCQESNGSAYLEADLLFVDLKANFLVSVRVVPHVAVFSSNAMAEDHFLQKVLARKEGLEPSSGKAYAPQTT
ncbi:MAG: hypothetical protein C5B49_16455 [Bdellovibrio sp.]|nr:MAG: hypothetical protein C5B49_16455 [Bdellovibrio sp.]